MFRCEWQEYANRPVESFHADVKGLGVIDCKIECMAEEDNNHLAVLTSQHLRLISLWSLIQVIANSLREHCGELVADSNIQLLFFFAMYYLEHLIDRALTRLLGHPQSPSAENCVEQEAPPNPSYMRICKAKIHVLLELAD